MDSLAINDSINKKVRQLTNQAISISQSVIQSLNQSTNELRVVVLNFVNVHKHTEVTNVTATLTVNRASRIPQNVEIQMLMGVFHREQAEKKTKTCFIYILIFVWNCFFVLKRSAHVLFIYWFSFFNLFSILDDQHTTWHLYFSFKCLPKRPLDSLYIHYSIHSDTLQTFGKKAKHK